MCRQSACLWTVHYTLLTFPLTFCISVPLRGVWRWLPSNRLYQYSSFFFKKNPTLQHTKKKENNTAEEKKPLQKREKKLRNIGWKNMQTHLVYKGVIKHQWMYVWSSPIWQIYRNKMVRNNIQIKLRGLLRETGQDLWAKKPKKSPKKAKLKPKIL